MSQYNSHMEDEVEVTPAPLEQAVEEKVPAEEEVPPAPLEPVVEEKVHPSQLEPVVE